MSELMDKRKPEKFKRPFKGNSHDIAGQFAHNELWNEWNTYHQAYLKTRELSEGTLVKLLSEYFVRLGVRMVEDGGKNKNVSPSRELAKVIVKAHKEGKLYAK